MDNNPFRVEPPFEPVSVLDHPSVKLAQQQLQNAELEATRRLCWQLITKLGGEITVSTREFASMPKDAHLTYQRDPDGAFVIRALPREEKWDT